MIIAFLSFNTSKRFPLSFVNDKRFAHVANHVASFHPVGAGRGRNGAFIASLGFFIKNARSAISIIKSVAGFADFAILSF